MSLLQRVSPAEALQKMRDEAFAYVDVRTEEEFEAGHPDGAINVPFMLAGPSTMVPNEEFVAVMTAAFAKNARLIVGCKSGRRSAKAAEILLNAGFTSVIDQSAGWDGTRGHFGETIIAGWSRELLPRESGRPEGRSYADLKKMKLDTR